MKKIIALVLLVVMAVVGCFFWGCGQKPVNTNEILIWHWMTDRHQAFETLAQQYSEQTGVAIKIQLFAPPDTYSQRITASAQANTLPDIFGILDKKEIFADFIKYGLVADLTDEYKKDDGAWEQAMFPKALEVNRFTADNIYDVKPGIYGVPIDVTNIQMLYNKDLLEKAGVKEVPRTFDQFLAAVKKLNSVGISGLVSGWGEIWLADAFASNYAFNIMGEQKIMDTYQGKVPYTDPDWLKVFRVFKTLSEAGAFAEGVVTKPNKEAEQDFALGRAAFAYNGSWCVNVYHDMNPDLNYSAMLPPKMNPDRPMKIWGGAGSSFVVNEQSAKKEQAIAFLKWLSAEKQQAYLARETRNLPANRKALAAIPEVLSDFAKVMDNTTHPTIWKYNELPKVTEAFDKGLQSIVIGEKTPKQVAEEVQKVKEREMEKQRNRQ